jgi:cytochrome c peroxidase
MKSTFFICTALTAAALVFGQGHEIRGAEPSHGQRKTPAAYENSATNLHLLQSPGATATGREVSDFGLGDSHISRLKPYPSGGPGSRTPFDLWRYGGRGDSSWKAATLPVPWEEWVKMCMEQKPTLMVECRAYMASRYDFHGKAIPGARMAGGKPIMAGPVARLPTGIDSFEALAELDSDEIKRRDLFPYKPLAHPLQTTAHMLFPYQWTKVHPEHERMDVDLDNSGRVFAGVPAAHVSDHAQGVGRCDRWTRSHAGQLLRDF